MALTPLEYATVVPIALCSTVIWFASLTATRFNTRFVCGIGFATTTSILAVVAAT